MAQTYDLRGVDEFDPFSTPINFKDHAALKKTRKTAVAFRIAKHTTEGGEGAHS